MAVRYSPELAERICADLARGMTLRAVCRQAGMPDEKAVREWARDNPIFAPQYTRARELGYQIMAEEILEIADDGTNDFVEREVQGGRKEILADHEHIARSRLRVDTRKWLLAKALPKVYGDKLQHSGPDGGDIPVGVTVRFVDADK